LNADHSVETKDNSTGEESQRSWPDYNRLGMLRLSDRNTNTRGRRDLVEHDNPTTRAPVLQAIEELARTSRTSTELRVVLNQLDATSTMDVKTVSEFMDVFPEELPGMPPDREIEFVIELVPGTAFF
jgi:hypothetical protein